MSGKLNLNFAKQNNNTPQNQQKQQQQQVQKPKETVIEDPKPKEQPMSESVDLEAELQQKRDFIAENIISIREWPSNDGGTCATLRLRELPVEALGDYANVAQVAEDVIQSLREVRDTGGQSIFMDFTIKYDRGRKTAQARAIKAKPEDNTLIAMLNIEHSVSGVKGSFLEMKQKDAPAEPEAPKVETNKYSFLKKKLY